MQQKTFLLVYSAMERDCFSLEVDLEEGRVDFENSPPEGNAAGDVDFEEGPPEDDVSEDVVQGMC